MTDLLLDPDDKHPPRPDLPILRHLTHREAHGFELGLWIGLAAGVFLAFGEIGGAVALVGFLRRGMVGTSTMPSAVRELFSDVWYILIGTVVGTPLGVFLGGLV